jgi:outer membrane protein TolC
LSDKNGMVHVRALGWGLAVFLVSVGIPVAVGAEEPIPAPILRELPQNPPNASLPAPKPASGERPYPINLATALQLAGAAPLEIAVASEQIQAAAARLERAETLWLPTVYLGADYFRHDGQIQDSPGAVSGTSKSSLMLGAGPYAVFAVCDALFEPLAARQTLRARQADLQAATNDSLLAVAEAYFNVEQSRGELAGADDAVRHAEELVRRTEKLAPGLVPPVEATRARVEAARRRQAREQAREHWRTASAELIRLLRFDPTTLVQPLEPPHLQVRLVDERQGVDDLIPIALTNRPELAAKQALVQATLERLRAERLRPLIPSVLLRGASTPVTGTLAGGYFGGGQNSDLSNFGARSDFDLQVLWEFQNLGFGNRARVAERRAENMQSVLELFRLQDRIAAEVSQAHAQIVSANARATEAEKELKDALDSVDKNFEGLSQTKRLGGDINVLVIRPQEVVAAVQALAQAYADYYTAIADANRAQFRLYRALGHPAQLVTNPEPVCQPAARPENESKLPVPAPTRNRESQFATDR